MATLTRMICLFGLLSFAAGQPALAQDDVETEDDDVNEIEGAGFVAIGPTFIDIEDLNDQLEAAGYPSFDRGVLSIGGGGYGVVGDALMIGGEGYGLISGEQAFQGRRVTVGGGYGFFDLGYLLRPAAGLRVYPMLGIGGGGMSLDIGSSGEADSVDDVLEDPDRQATLTRGSFLVSLSAGAEYQIGLGGVGIGLRAGWVFAPYTGSWKLDENTIEDEPDASLAGPFIRLLILP